MLVIKVVDDLRWNTNLKLLRRGRLLFRARLDCVPRYRFDAFPFNLLAMFGANTKRSRLHKRVSRECYFFNHKNNTLRMYQISKSEWDLKLICVHFVSGVSQQASAFAQLIIDWWNIELLRCTIGVLHWEFDHWYYRFDSNDNWMVLRINGH